MNRKDKKLYLEIIDLCHKEWLKDHSIFDREKNRYILDLEYGFIMFYPENGKILLTTGKGSPKPVFRSSKQAFMLTSDIEKLINDFKGV